MSVLCAWMQAVSLCCTGLQWVLRDSAATHAQSTVGRKVASLNPGPGESGREKEMVCYVQVPYVRQGGYVTSSEVLVCPRNWTFLQYKTNKSTKLRLLIDILWMKLLTFWKNIICHVPFQIRYVFIYKQNHFEWKLMCKWLVRHRYYMISRFHLFDPAFILHHH